MYGIMLTASGGLQIDGFLGYATSILEWIITSLGSVITFFISNPALLIWPVVSLIGILFIYFRKLV